MATSSGTLGGAQRHPATIILLAVAALAALATVFSLVSGGGNDTSPLNSGGTRLASMSCEEMVEANNADQLPDDLSSREQLSLLDCALQVQIEEAKDAGDEAEVRELQAQRDELSTSEGLESTPFPSSDFNWDAEIRPFVESALTSLPIVELEEARRIGGVLRITLELQKSAFRMYPDETAFHETLRGQIARRIADKLDEDPRARLIVIVLVAPHDEGDPREVSEFTREQLLSYEGSWDELVRQNRRLE